MRHVTRRLLIELAVPVGLLPSLTQPLLSSKPARTGPLAEPFDYPANVANGDVAIGAGLVSRKEIRKVFKDRLFPNNKLLRLSQDFTVVEVGFYPSDDTATAVDLQAFRLLSGQEPVSATAPEDAVFELIHGRPRNAPIQLAEKDKKSERTDLYEDAMRAALFLRGLPLEPLSGPRAGYLYFSVPRKEWKGAESLVVEYVSSDKPIKLVLPAFR